MNKLLCLALAVCWLGLPCYGQEESAQNLLEEMMEGRADIGVLRAKFAMRNIAPPDDPIESEGSLLFVQPRRIVFRIADPMGEDNDSVILVDDERLYEYDPVLEQLQIYDRRKDRQIAALFAAFDNDLNQLTEAYEVQPFAPGDETERAVAGLVLRPKTAGEDGPVLFERMRLYLREEDYLPVKIQIINEPGSMTELDFTRILVNPAVEPEETQIALPAGTKVIENERDFRDLAEPARLPAPASVVPPDSARSVPEAGE